MTIRTYAFLLIINLLGCALTQPSNDFKSFRRENDLNIENKDELIKLLNEVNYGSKEEKDLAITKILNIDLNSIKQEYRYAFLDCQLDFMYKIGDWDGLVWLQKYLMNQESKKNQSITDADILIEIASYYSNTTWPSPTNNTVVLNRQDIFNYWKDNYQNKEEAIKIYKYIIDNFDLNYISTVLAATNLAGLYYYKEDYENALNIYLFIYKQQKEDLFSISRITKTGRLITAEDHLNNSKERAIIDSCDKLLLNRIKECLCKMDEDTYIKTKEQLKIEFQNDDIIIDLLSNNLENISKLTKTSTHPALNEEFHP